MRTRLEHSSAVLLGCLGTIVLLASCSSDLPTESDEARISADQASPGRVSVCHRSGPGGTIIEISASGLPAHLDHGDYLTSLTVTHEIGLLDHRAHFSRQQTPPAAEQPGACCPYHIGSIDRQFEMS
jgi:hypothetical protein